MDQIGTLALAGVFICVSLTQAGRSIAAGLPVEESPDNTEHPTF